MSKSNPKFKLISISSDNPCNQTISVSVCRQNFSESKNPYLSKAIEFSCGSEDRELVRQSIINKAHVLHSVMLYAERVQVRESTFIKNKFSENEVILPLINKKIFDPYQVCDNILPIKFSDEKCFRIYNNIDSLIIGNDWSFNYIVLPYNKMDIVFCLEDFEEYNARMKGLELTPEKQLVAMIEQMNKLKNDFIAEMNTHNKANNLEVLSIQEKQLLDTYNNFLFSKANEQGIDKFGC